MSLDEALEQKNLILREAWGQYDRPNVPMKVRAGKRMFTVWPDDRPIKNSLLTTINGITNDIDRLLGFGTQQYMERLRVIETAVGRGFEIIKVPFTEQLRIDASKLTDEDMEKEHALFP